MRAKKAFRNIVWGLAYEVVTLACGLILPRLILMSFGSKYFGVTSAITQFLGAITLFQAGISGVTIAALYKPLAEGDTRKISVITKSTDFFLRRITLLFTGSVLAIACVYPFLVIDEFSWIFTASLVVVMSISTYAQFFIAQAYQSVLQADQQLHIFHGINIIKVVANTALAALLISMGRGIHAVRLGASVVYVLAALFTIYYVKKKYKIIPDVEKDYSTIKQRWDNFWQYLAGFISLNSGVIIISVFSNVYAVSVYSVYYLVVAGVTTTLHSCTRGIDAAFGNMLAKDEETLLKSNFRIYEQVVFILATLLFSITAVMIIPFVEVYTAEVTDTNYIEPLFAYIFICGAFFSCIRTPYVGVVNAAGHFRQMRNPALHEAAINIAISITLVHWFGIVGVAVGTLAAYLYRTLRYAVYLSKKIIKRSLFLFAKRLILSLVCILMVVAISSFIPHFENTGFILWALNAVIVAVVAIVLIIATELIFYKSDLAQLTKIVRNSVFNRN